MINTTASQETGPTPETTASVWTTRMRFRLKRGNKAPQRRRHGESLKEVMRFRLKRGDDVPQRRRHGESIKEVIGEPKSWSWDRIQQREMQINSPEETLQRGPDFRGFRACSSRGRLLGMGQHDRFRKKDEALYYTFILWWVVFTSTLQIGKMRH